MKEKDLQTRVNRYLINRWEGTAAFELKIVSKYGSALPFSAVKEHQLHALRTAKRGRLAYKIPDDARGQKPFDCFVLHMVPAYVAVMFWKRGCRHFYLIDVDDFIRESEQSLRKSLTEQRAEEIGRRVVME